jgi:hypothetical protein
LRSFEKTAFIAYNGDAQGGVEGVVCIDERGERFLQICGADSEGDAHESGITLHTGVVARIGEEYAIGDTQRAEDAPTVEEADLARRQNCIPGIADVPVVK